MGNTSKNINKRIIGAVLWTTIIGAAGLSMTPKGRSFWQKAKDFFKSGLDELKKDLGDKDSKKKKSDKDK